MTFSAKIVRFTFCVTLLCYENISAQNLTSSPYSRYGVGELNQTGFAQISAMGNAYVALSPDTTAPLFINAANPAAISGIRLTTLELGGMALFSNFKTNNSNINTKTSNFSYACLGFPIRQLAGACFGVMPYSNIGYNLLSNEHVTNVGDITYQYIGDGGLNNVFTGLGFMPFKRQPNKFASSAFRDSLLNRGHLKKHNRVKKQRDILSSISIGGKVNYLFGSLNQTTNVIYPGSINYYNTRRYRSASVGDVTANFGIQGALTVDSLKHKALRHKVKIGFGYYVSLPGLVDVKYNNLIYNYSLGSTGFEQIKDTVLNIVDQKNSIKLPLEQGFGLMFKKGEKLTVAADITYTNWQQFRYLDTKNELKNSYKISFGINYVPNKYASGSGAYGKRIHYRFGVMYGNGFLELKNTTINNYALSAGIGFPVGLFRQYSMVNITGQFGQMGSLNNNLIKENYARVVIGFTFNDRWFNKFRYD